MKGAAINPGFLGDDVQTPANFAKLTDPNYAYTPYVPASEKNAKTRLAQRARLLPQSRQHDVRGRKLDHRRFLRLDDLYTENPRVISGMIDIYGSWIDRFGIDGYRIDTAKHVNPEFWRSFVPAMLARAKAKGIPNFHIFGEVTAGMEPGYLARWTKIADYPAVLDFAFMNAVIQTVAENKPTRVLSNLFEGDVLYAKEEATADILPTFLGNHDHGRFARDVRAANPNASDDEILKRVELGHAMLLTLRGVPTIYSGDEQGFAGDGNDQDAREDMFASKVASYNDNKLVGTTKTTATDSFVPSHPLYREIATLARLRTANPALTRGRQLIRARGDRRPVRACRASIPPRAANI